MKILHLAAGNRWTGAAAPAFAEVEALRAAGVDAHFAYVGGYKLETKLAGHSFAHPIIDRAQNPVSFLRTVKAIRKLVSELGIDILHAHLTWDHLLARVAARGSRVVVARTFHSRRTLRRDVFTSWLVKGTGPLFVINETFLGSPVLRGRGVYTPPPLDSRLFNPVGPNVRSTYSIDPSTKVIAVIGKLSQPSAAISAGRYWGPSALVQASFLPSITSSTQPALPWPVSKPSGPCMLMRKMPPGLGSSSHSVIW